MANHSFLTSSQDVAYVCMHGSNESRTQSSRVRQLSPLHKYTLTRQRKLFEGPCVIHTKLEFCAWYIDLRVDLIPKAAAVKAAPI